MATSIVINAPVTGTLTTTALTQAVAAPTAGSQLVVTGLELCNTDQTALGVVALFAGSTQVGNSIELPPAPHNPVFVLIEVAGIPLGDAVACKLQSTTNTTGINYCVRTRTQPTTMQSAAQAWTGY